MVIEYLRAWMLVLFLLNGLTCVMYFLSRSGHPIRARTNETVPDPSGLQVGILPWYEVVGITTLPGPRGEELGDG